MDIKISPSILAADFYCLGQQVEMVEQAGAEYLHIDVMDGQFVPNITFGPCVVEKLRPHSKLFFDVHLMIEEPERYFEAFVKAGADGITFHAEATRHLYRAVQQVKALGVKVGVALNPGTPASALECVLDELDMALVMTVNPGLGGQAYMPQMEAKIRALHQAAPSLAIEVDGGISSKNIRRVTEAGATVIVAGSSIFNAQDAAEEMRLMREQA